MAGLAITVMITWLIDNIPCIFMAFHTEKMVNNYLRNYFHLSVLISSSLSHIFLYLKVNLLYELGCKYDKQRNEEDVEKSFLSLYLDLENLAQVLFPF